ncbi:tRNA lysidine(34) synthetase TilS [Roseomonas harenae]|uniref:tRNA lysidine(34) synthetase TilS n=1 Tax=Muricoccus harenae TaxID=2692566 RepID=UPI001F22CE39|nr:tRNA lysidine(34) synthetase TilS [Roseomonas harenae]
MAGLGPFGSAPVLAVGVSGGPHSLALAVLARDWVAGRDGRVLALVADHGLRSGSGEEAAGVASRLVTLGIPARVLPLGLPPGSALHERARAARLSALIGAAEAEGAPWLLLGHHIADQAETIAFRALRGSGDEGLSGMAPARPGGGALILRPLLGLPPAQIERFLAAEGLAPVRDPSNDDLRFARARLRRALRDPAGESHGTAALAAAASAFSIRRSRMREAVAARLAVAACFREEGWVRLDQTALGTDRVAEATLSALVRTIGGGGHPPARANSTALLARGGGSLAGALWRGTVLCREAARCAPPLLALPGALWDGRWRVVSAPDGAWIGALGQGGPRGGLPATVAAGLPALRDKGGRLLCVPALEGGARLEFRPISGPIA